jgi:predicted ATPase
LSEKHPLLVLLDDLQWADSASIELLFHLAANNTHSLGCYIIKGRYLLFILP